MTMPMPKSYSKPDLTALQTRMIQVPPIRHQLEQKLLPWIEEVVRNTKHPPTIRRMPPARYLLQTAEGIEEIMIAPPPMALSSGPGQQTIDARFYFAGMRGGWFVEHIKFSPRLGSMQLKVKADMEAADHAAAVKRMLERAEAENKLHPKFRAFPAAKYTDDPWTEDVNRGAALLDRELKIIYASARAEAAIPDNPYSPKDVGLSLMGGGVGVLGTTGEAAEKLAKVYEHTDQALTGIQMFTTIKEDVEAIKKYKEDGNSVLKGGKSLGDVLVGRGIEVVAALPGVGPFVKGFAGMFFDFASANFAGEVTKIRCRIYLWYIAGFISGLTTVATDVPVSEFDRKYKDFGLGRAACLSFDQRMQVQISLMHWASEHYTKGNSSGSRMATPEDWTLEFPDGYLAHWSPELLARAISLLICRRPYIVE